MPGLDFQEAVPADQHGGEADEAVHEGDEIGHARHPDDAGPPEPERRADEPSGSSPTGRAHKDWLTG